MKVKQKAKIYKINKVGTTNVYLSAVDKVGRTARV